MGGGNMDVPATSERVEKHTSECVNRMINERTACTLRYYAKHPEQIDDRLRELDEEWDVERVLETNASTLALSGAILGIMVSRKFFLLSIVVLGFLLQHAIQGWCPPLPLIRRMGYRTQSEIEKERYALRMLRGDVRAREGEEGDAEELLASLGLEGA